MAFADRKKLSRAVHGQYLAPFRDRWARGAVLWPLAHAVLGSSDFYDSLWRRRGVLADVPSLIVWGVRDPAFRPQLAERWREALPQARSVELATGHWPQEEAPDDVVRELRRFLDG
jgi:haloalkane dehalogenase